MLIGVVRHAKPNGKGFNPELSEIGRLDCRILKTEMREDKYDVCFSSPKLRTFETAIILAGDDTLVLKEERLIDDGSKEEIKKRIEELMADLKEKYNDKKVLLVTHLPVISVIQEMLNKTDKDIKHCYYEIFEI